jgi:FkbM family methyltransferase
MNVIKIEGVTFFVRGKVDADVCREVCERRCYEKPRLGFLIQPGERWLDLGANVGAFAVWAEKQRGATVYGYEACEENASVARRNLLANGCRSVVETAFVTHKDAGVTSMNFKPETPSRSSTRSGGVQRFVKNRSLASLVRQHKPHGIKIDIEGGEFELLDHGFPLDGVRAVALEYHFRFDKSYANARRRLMKLKDAFPNQAYRKALDTEDSYGGWQDETMFFWR